MLSKFSVNKPYTVVVAVILIAILGAASLTNMSTDLLPSINLPYAVVLTTYPGASPEEVEMVVTSPIEQLMASISNIKEVRSVSSENMSFVILEFYESVNMDSAVIEMRESLDIVKAYMPERVGTPIILKLNPDMIPVMVASAAVAGQDISESSTFLEAKVIPELESVEGVASVSASGLVENRIHVVVSQKKIDEINSKIKQAISAMIGHQEAALSQGIPSDFSLSKADTDNPDTDVSTGAGDTSGAGDVHSTPALPEITITKEMISGILKGQNFSMPAGYIEEEGVNYLVRTGDEIKNLDELKKLPVLMLPIPGMAPVELQDVADIVMLDNSSEMYSKVNGNDAIILTIQKQSGYTTADLAKRLRDKMSDIMEKNEGVELVPLMDQGKYIDIAVDSITTNLIYGGILAILILLIFLRDIRPTIVVGLAIPISLVTAFVMMYFGKITLNIISMGGLALGVGMLVDNSIVVIENIYRMRSEGKSAKEAAIEGSRQVAGAITSSTLTTVAVFLPIVFTKGLTKQIFTDMGLTIAFSLLASLIIALTLVPMMAAGILAKDIKKEHRIFETVKKGYTKLLKLSLRHGWAVILLAGLLFVGSFVGALSIGTELFPPVDSGQLTVTLSMPKGTKLEDTATAANKITEIIMGIDDVETVGATIGRGMLGMVGIAGTRGYGGSTDSVSFYVTLKDNRSNSTDKIAQIIRDKTQSPEYQVSVESTSMDILSLTGGTIAMNIRGREFDILEMIAGEVADIVSSVEGTVDVSDGIEETAPELRVIVDKEKSIAKGLTIAQVYIEINKLLSDEPVATTLSMANNDYDIFVMDESENGGVTKHDILELEIPTPEGKTVPLKEIANVVEARGFFTITRTDQQRYVTVRAGLAEGYNIGIVSNRIENKLKDYQLPEGYTIEIEGENRMIREAFSDLYLMLAIAIAFIYLVMVAQFQSLLSPFIVMFTIPLAFTGGFLGLLVTGHPVSVVAFVGFILLSGVVVNNGIVFVDYVNQLRRQGLTKYDALVKAGNDRLRPILMTALTTIFALFTLSLGTGEGTELMQPMAIATIGGLAYATLLTLILIPVLYNSFHKK